MASSDYVSDVALLDRNRDTDVVNIVIEPGAERLYLVLISTNPRIWTFSGATERVRHAALIANVTQSDFANPPVGAVGLPAARVSTHFSCASAPQAVFAPDHPYSIHYAAALNQALGRPEVSAPPQSSLSNHARFVRLPSGRIEPAPEVEPPAPRGFDPIEWREVVRFFDRGGLVDIDAARVVGAPALDYDVLPFEYGLAQLVARGALRRTPDSQPGQPVYRVVRAIPHIPAGLYGAHSVTFEIEPGVPPPSGDLAHSCMIILATGEERGHCHH